LRLTKANQFGLLGFGGNKHDSYQPMLEVSAAYLLRKDLVVGAEYRMKPNSLKSPANDQLFGGANIVNLQEDDAFDFSVANAPTKNISLDAAYVYLGNIARSRCGWCRLWPTRCYLLIGPIWILNMHKINHIFNINKESNMTLTVKAAIATILTSSTLLISSTLMLTQPAMSETMAHSANLGNTPMEGTGTFQAFGGGVKKV